MIKMDVDLLERDTDDALKLRRRWLVLRPDVTDSVRRCGWRVDCRRKSCYLQLNANETEVIRFISRPNLCASLEEDREAGRPPAAVSVPWSPCFRFGNVTVSSNSSKRCTGMSPFHPGPRSAPESMLTVSRYTQRQEADGPNRASLSVAAILWGSQGPDPFTFWQCGEWGSKCATTLPLFSAVLL